uniref:PH domain-containing protein n=1 Tax=Macrostomum lignano TaxID=282301 RepID=A0A1I8FHY7_9PLAT
MPRKRIGSVRLTAEERQQPHGSYCLCSSIPDWRQMFQHCSTRSIASSGTSLAEAGDRRLLQLQEQDDNSRHISPTLRTPLAWPLLDSSLSNMQSDSLASTAAKTVGWLNVKNWLVHKKRKVELAPQRAWRRYWVCLKGTVLLFFKDSQQQHQQMMMDAAGERVEPKHSLDLDSWIAALHSACASQIARQRSKSDTVYLMETEIRKLEGNIDVDSKMKMMAEKQLTAISDSRSRAQTILPQHPAMGRESLAASAN